MVMATSASKGTTYGCGNSLWDCAVPGRMGDEGPSFDLWRDSWVAWSDNCLNAVPNPVNIGIKGATVAATFGAALGPVAAETSAECFWSGVLWGSVPEMFG
jgi:hypothetical protein